MKTKQKKQGTKKRAKKIDAETYYDLSYQRLIEYCEKRGFVICEKHDPIDGGGQIIIEDKEITIDSKPNNEMKMYYLLHEIGHALAQQYKHHTFLYTENILKIGSDDIGKLKYNCEKLNILSVEIEAWNRGLLLAKKLNIHVNRRKFNTTKSISLMSYIDFMFEDFFKKKRDTREKKRKARNKKK